MKCIPCLLLIILAAPSLRADLPSDELLKLRESYKKAVERATSPITATYVTELKKLMEKNTKAGNLDAAVAIKTELESVRGAGTSAASALVTPSVAAPADNKAASQAKLSTSEKKRIESFFVGKTWATVNPGTTKVLELQYFAKNGTGARKRGDEVSTMLKWTMNDDGTILVTAAGFPKEITFMSPEMATMIVHADPPLGDLTQEMKLSSETIPGVR